MMIILLAAFVPLVFATTYYGPSTYISPASVAPGGSVTMYLSSGSGTTVTNPPSGSSVCNPANPSTCIFVPQACTSTDATNYYQIFQATVTDPNNNEYMLGSATTSGLSNPQIGRFTNSPGGPYAPAINVSLTDSPGSIPFGTGVGNFYALTSNLPNPPNNVNSDGPYYWWTAFNSPSTHNVWGDNLRLDTHTNITPTSVSGTYTYDLEGQVLCSGQWTFFDFNMQFTVTAIATPSITTLLSSATITVGDSVTDTATITGGNSPTGTITFNVYSGSSSESCTGTPVATQTVTLPTLSTTFSGLAAGSYEVQATYSGDSNNAGPVSDSCGEEPLTVSPATPTLSTSTTPSSITLPSTLTVTDTATVTGGSSFLAGTVSFTLYQGT